MPVLLTLLCMLWCQSVTAPPRANDSDEAQLRQIKTVLWPQAYRQQEVPLLDQILHPMFRAIDAEGNVTTKQDEIAYIKKHKPSYSTFRFEIERLEVFEGRFAVVSGTGIIEGEGKEGKRETRYRSSNHFVKEGGRWRAVSSHVSGVKAVSGGR